MKGESPSGFWLASASLLAFAACSPGSQLGDGGSGPSSAAHTGSGSQGGAGPNSSTMAAFMTGSTGPGQTNCDALPDEDKDGDGWSINDSDCNDCDANVNPGAIEVVVTDPDPNTMMVPPPADEDCDGIADNAPPASCDGGLALDSASPGDAAKAIELCKSSTGPDDYGVVSVNYVRANGDVWNNNDLQHGILDNFGSNVPPQKGSKLLAISSGHARTAGQAGECTNLSCPWQAGTPPMYFPQDVPGCSGSLSIFDDVALEAEIKAPTNATGYSFDFKFTSWEFPEWVCTDYNDQFVALVNPPPPGAINGNISFDTNNNPVSVNIAFFDVCANCVNFASQCSGTCPPAPNPCCPAGASELFGTGFDNPAKGKTQAGGTVWLRTQAPVTGGETFTIRFAIWDTGDSHLDSTALVDNFQWIATGGTVVIGTTPPPPQ